MSTKRTLAQEWVTRYQNQIAAGIDVEFAKGELPYWQKAVEEEAQRKIDTAVADRTPAPAAPTPAAEPEPRSHHSRLEQLEAMEAELGPGNLQYDLAQAEQKILARSPHLAGSPTAVRSIAIASLKAEEQWKSYQAGQNAGPDNSQKSLAELRAELGIVEDTPEKRRAEREQAQAASNAAAQREAELWMERNSAASMNRQREATLKAEAELRAKGGQ